MTTSSTSRTRRRSIASGRPTKDGPARRSSSRRPVWAGPGRRRRATRRGRPRSAATWRARSSAWSKPAISASPDRRRRPRDQVDLVVPHERGHATGQPPEHGPVVPVLDAGHQLTPDALVVEQGHAAIEPVGHRHGRRAAPARRRTPDTAPHRRGRSPGRSGAGARLRRYRGGGTRSGPTCSARRDPCHRPDGFADDLRDQQEEPSAAPQPRDIRSGRCRSRARSPR